MFVKIFTQIFDSSIADNYQHRQIFIDLCILADERGVLDMTLEAIAGRTRVPMDLLRHAIEELEKPDPRSRSKAMSGRRLVPLDRKRGWGWKIVNYHVYRGIKNKFDRNEYMIKYMRKRRDKADSLAVKQSLNKSLTGVLQSLTPASASASPSSSVPKNGECEGKEMPARSILDLKDKLERAEKQRQQLKEKGATESPTGIEWHNRELFEKYKELGKRIRRWTSQITGV